LTRITNVTLERHEYVLPSVMKKKVVAASMLSTEAFPTAKLALQLEVPMTVTSILDLNVGEEC
jgi:hypothetical protein